MSDESQTVAEPSRSGRRDFLRGAAFAGAGVAVGAVGAGVAGAVTNDGDSRSEVSFDVACLGQTFRAVFLPALPDLSQLNGGLADNDLRGSPFWVEGWIYPAGTIPEGDGFIPTEDGVIGTWICRGHLIISPDRADPHIASHQEYYFGDFVQNPIGAEMLMSEGLEGRDTERWSAERAITGGTGQYRGARGVITQSMIGFNSTIDFDGFNALNFRFDADIDLP